MRHGSKNLGDISGVLHKYGIHTAKNPAPCAYVHDARIHDICVDCSPLEFAIIEKYINLVIPRLPQY